MRKNHEGLLGIRKDNYPGLPDTLKDYNYYYEEGGIGHVIMAIPETVLNEAIQNGDLDMFECPVPCKYVLEQGFRIYENHVIVDCAYDRLLGLNIDPSYFELNGPINCDNDVSRMVKLEVGQPFHRIIHSEGVLLNIGKSSIDITVGFDTPSDNEIEQFMSTARAEFRLVTVDSILFLLVKFGNLSWMDAPYGPVLSGSLEHLDTEIPEGSGFSVFLYLVDIRTNILKSQRLISWSTKFSREFQRMMKETTQESMTVTEYSKRLNNVFRRYPTNALVRLSKVYYKTEE